VRSRKGQESERHSRSAKQSMSLRTDSGKDAPEKMVCTPHSLDCHAQVPYAPSVHETRRKTLQCRSHAVPGDGIRLAFVRNQPARRWRSPCVLVAPPDCHLWLIDASNPARIAASPVPHISSSCEAGVSGSARGSGPAPRGAGSHRPGPGRRPVPPAGAWRRVTRGPGSPRFSASVSSSRARLARRIGT
jgi:hypothetical protein